MLLIKKIYTHRLSTTLQNHNFVCFISNQQNENLQQWKWKAIACGSCAAVDVVVQDIQLKVDRNYDNENEEVIKYSSLSYMGEQKLSWIFVFAHHLLYITNMTVYVQ